MRKVVWRSASKYSATATIVLENVFFPTSMHACMLCKPFNHIFQDSMETWQAADEVATRSYGDYVTCIHLRIRIHTCIHAYVACIHIRIRIHTCIHAYTDSYGFSKRHLRQERHISHARKHALHDYEPASGHEWYARKGRATAYQTPQSRHQRSSSTRPVVKLLRGTRVKSKHDRCNRPG